MRKLIGAAVLAAALTGPAAAADPTGPAVEIRVRSVNDLLEYAEFVGDIAGQADTVKQGVQFAKAITNAKTGLEGIDPTRPVGGYVIVTPDVVSSPIVIVIPVADEDAFRGLLKNKLSIPLKDPVDGVTEFALPNFPPKVFVRFANKSAYFTVRDAAGLAPKTLIPPAVLFADKDPAVASVKLHFDRIPTDVRKTVFGQFEMALGQVKAKKLDGETDATGKLKAVALDAVADAAHAVFTDGQTLAVRLLADPKTDDLTAEVSLTGKSGSELAKVLKNVSGKPGMAGRLPAAANPLVAVGTRLAVSEAVRDKLKPGVDGFLDELLEKSDPNGKDFTKMIFDAVAPTILAGELDFGVVATGPDAKGAFGFAAAMKMKDAKPLDKLLLKFAPFIPEDQVKLDLLEDKVNGVSLHRITLMDEDQVKKFGSDTVWLGVGDTLLAASLEKDGKIIKAIAAGDGKKSPLVGAEVALGRLFPLIQKDVPADKMKALVADTFGKDPAGKDTVRLTVDGGDALTVRLTAKGKAVKYVVGLGKLKKD